MARRLAGRPRLALAWLLASVLMIAGCGGPPPASPSVGPSATGPVAGGRLVIAEMLDPLNYDPHMTSNEWVTNLSEKVIEKLIYLGPDGAYKPGLATSWEVDPAGTSIVFHLRSGVTFHDGTPFDAQAVKFNLDRIANPETQAQAAAFYLGPYAGTEVIDPTTVRVSWRAPYAPGLDIFSLGFFGMVSPTAIEKFGKDFATHLVGTGPFMWSEYKRDEGLTLVRNPNYRWNPAIFTNDGPPYLDEVTYRYAADPAVRAGMLTSGEVDILEGVQEQQLENFRQQGYQIVEVVSPGIPGIALMNTTRPPTDDLRVRQAIIYGTDREAIAKAAWAGVWPVAHGPLTRSSWAYDPAVEAYYPYDPTRATALLEEAGWKLGPDGIRVKDGQRLSVSVIYAIGTWLWTDLFQAQMRAIGIEVNVLQMEPLASGQAAAKGEANIAPNVFTGSDPNVLSLVFSSQSIGLFNWTFFKSDELDQLLMKAVTQMNREDRIATYSRIQRIIMDNALGLPLADPVVLIVSSPKVHGTVVDPRGLPMYLNDAWKER
jgi:peptide/nickel transport system substrate-binding protein